MREMKLEELRAVQLEILDKVDEFCKINQIKYFLIYGTLIGAIRHNGYIPWDDDIDIGMLRTDYERFVASFKVQGYKLLEPRTVKDFHCPFGKVAKDDTVIREANDLVQSDYMGVNIDVFPIDSIPESAQDQKKLVTSILLWRRMLEAKIIVIHSKRVWYKNLILYLAKKLLFFVKTGYIVNKIISLARKHEGTDSLMLGCLVWGYGEKELMPREYFEDVITKPFEHKQYAIPICYDEYLKSIYGDYMQLPPIEKRKTHHVFNAYYKN